MITYELNKMIQNRRNHRFKFMFEDGYEYTGNKWLDGEQLLEQVAKHGKVTIGFNDDKRLLEQEPILDKVLGDIKTEIEECWQMYEDRFDVGDCLDIIDKHISGKES